MDAEDLAAIIARFRGIRVNENDNAIAQQMEHSIQGYNKKARENNIRFVRECVEAVATADLETEQQKVNRMARVLFGMENWGTNINLEAKPHLSQSDLATTIGRQNALIKYTSCRSYVGTA
jgi:predicted transcriptional regulator